jgi:hypothetical protein
MAQNKLVTFNSTALTTSVANVLNPPTLSGGTGIPGNTTGTYVVIRILMIVNKSASPTTFSFWKGATGASAAGTEVFGTSLQISGNQTAYYPVQMRLDVGDYLTGQASANTSLTVTPMGEIGIA